MLEHLVARGYQPGGGLISPEGVFYLNIPKNASTYTTNLLLKNGWVYHNLNTDVANIKECIALVRDPVDRWVSGFATYAASYVLGSGYGSDYFVEDYNTLTERVIFDTLVFDDHTTEQVKFLEQIDLTSTTLFRLNKTYVNDIAQHLNINITESIELNNNSSENNYDVKQISKFMQERINQDPVLKAKIIERYNKDYQLLQTATFYDPR